MNAGPSPEAQVAMASVGAASLRMRLRNETRAAHEELDAGFLALGLPGARADYVRFLRANEACLRALAPPLERSGILARLPGLRGEDRLAAVVADLDAMGLRPMVPEAFALDRPSLAQGVGIAYVLEGSRLGARQILKRFERLGRLDKADPITTFFLESAGEAERFRSFIDAAESILTTEPERNLAIEAANRTFEYFIGAVRLADRAPCDGE